MDVGAVKGRAVMEAIMMLTMSVRVAADARWHFCSSVRSIHGTTTQPTVLRIFINRGI